MIRVENTKVCGFEEAVRGARNSFNSWDKSDSFRRKNYSNFTEEFILGQNDLELLKRLANAGDASHRKYLRAISVWMDVTGPLYWWKQMDQYKVGTTSLSTSTMHKITEKEFTLDDFSHEHLSNICLGISEGYAFIPEFVFKDLIDTLNECRKKYLETKNKDYWYQIIQLLPSSYNQKRTISMNYENVLNILRQRKNHKLDEWEDFRQKLLKLPCMEAICGG